MRILWHSCAPWIKSGYGGQTALFAPRIAALGHEVAISGYAGMTHGTVNWGDIPVFPGGINGAQGMDVIAYWWEKAHADVCIALTDAWAMSAGQMALLPRSVFWMPVDQAPLSKMNREALATSKATPLAMSRFGQRVLADAGFAAGYVPHGIDTQVFAPLAPGHRAAQRDAAGIGPDTFVIGINAANRDTHRKRFPEQLEAFARFHARHPDSKLMLHTAKEHPKGEDLPLILDELGFGPGMADFCNQDQYAAGEITAAELATAFYGVLDLYSGVTTEGFGIPLIEAAGCGVPVVGPGGRPHWPSGIPAGAAGREVAGPGWLAETQQFWVKAHQANWDQPVTADIDRCYEQAWQARENGTLAARAEACREHALQYDADLVTTTFWKPYLEQLAESL